MAAIRVINVGGKEYIQVITYEDSPRGQRIKVLKSFGPNILSNRVEAKIFKANYEMLEKLKDDPQVEEAENLELVEKIGAAAAGAILGWKVLDYLFKKWKKK